MKKISIIIFVTSLLACSKKDTNIVTTCDSNISYKTTVKQIFVASCSSSGCHDGNNLPSLADYQTAHDAAGQIKTAVANGVMPKNATLSATDKSAIICWTSNGAMNN